MSELGSSLVIEEIKKNNNALFCAATGDSPLGLYRLLVEHSQFDSKLFHNIRIVKLDEWGGIAHNSSISCEHYLNINLLDPLKIYKDNYISFKSDSINPDKECKRIQTSLDAQGSIDICVLGLGKNGHIGFNEPDTYLQQNCHVAKLTIESTNHSMVESSVIKPSYGLTLGMKDILQSKKIILLISGEKKEKVIKSLLQKQISTELPASFLWLHDNVECLIVE